MRTEIKAALVLGLFGILGMVIWGINSGRQGNVELPMDVGKDGGKATRLASDSGGRQGGQPLSRDLGRDGNRGAESATPGRSERGAGDRTGRRPETSTTPPARDPAPSVATPPQENRDRDTGDGRDAGAGRDTAGGSRDGSRLAQGGGDPLPPQDTAGNVSPGGIGAGNQGAGGSTLSDRGSSLADREGGAERSPVMGPEAVPSSRDGSNPPGGVATPERSTRTPDSGRAVEEQPLRPERGGAANIGDLPRSPTLETSHTIQLGDTFISIAREKYGADKHWVRIQAANPGVDPTKLLPGTVIKLPSLEEIRNATTSPKPAAAETTHVAPQAGGANGPAARRAPYKVADGDTLISIARTLLKDESRWPEIFALNRDKLSSPDHIIEGMLLKIPE